jgi:hypothetical protein
MVNQTALTITAKQGGDFATAHFRHNGIFVALSIDRAAIYASVNKFRSDILKRIMELLIIIRARDENFSLPYEFNLLDRKIHVLRRIIIELSGVEDDDLRKGDCNCKALKFLRRVLPTLGKRGKFQF